VFGTTPIDPPQPGRWEKVDGSSEDLSWLEAGERVLWHGQPSVDRPFRIRMWSRGIVLFALIAIIGPAVADISSDLTFHSS
jgi:hypothetical protein